MQYQDSAKTDEWPEWNMFHALHEQPKSCLRKCISLCVSDDSVDLQFESWISCSVFTRDLRREIHSQSVRLFRRQIAAHSQDVQREASVRSRRQFVSLQAGAQITMLRRQFLVSVIIQHGQRCRDCMEVAS